MNQGIGDLAQVVRRNVRRHSNGDPRGTVDQHVGQPCRQNRGLGERVIEVGSEVDGVLVDVGQQLVGYGRQPGLRVAHGRWWVSVDAAEIPLAGDERVAHGEVLRHSHQGVVYGALAVRMELAQHLTGNPGALSELGARTNAHIVHGVEDPSLHRLQSVPDVGERPRHDHAHGVGQVRSPHLVCDAESVALLVATGRLLPLVHTPAIAAIPTVKRAPRHWPPPAVGGSSGRPPTDYAGQGRN